MADNLEKLYEKYNVLSDAKEKVSQHTKEYLESIEGVKGSENEKMLAAQILSKFFKHFPELQNKALNALLDLCEDDEARIRACAMRYLVSICKDVKAHIPKVTDILAQMMQLEEQRDLTTAAWCLNQLWKDDSVSVLKTLFSHIQSLSNPTARQKCVDFVYKKLLRPMANQPPEIENIVVEESKKLLQIDVTSDEILNLITALTSSKYGRTVNGQREILNLMTDIMELDSTLDVMEKCSVDRLIICIQHALPLFSAKNDSSKHVIYYCEQVLPQLDKIAELKHGEKLQLQLLRQLAELTIHCGKLENPSLSVVQIFDKIKTYMPTPPEDADVYKMPNFEFSLVELLLFAFHRLARQCPDFLTHDPQVLKDFRSRLVYFSRGVQGCNKVLNMSSNQTLKIPTNSTTSSKVRIAPALLANLNMLIKDLFYQPPMYKCNVTLSFKNEVPADKETKTATTPSPSATGTQKRHVPITFDNGSSHSSTTSKQSRPHRPGDNMKLYTPPSGKFSNNFQSYDRSSGRGMRGRGRGGFRGRGSRGNWRH